MVQLTAEAKAEGKGVSVKDNKFHRATYAEDGRKAIWQFHI